MSGDIDGTLRKMSGVRPKLSPQEEVIARIAARDPELAQQVTDVLAADEQEAGSMNEFLRNGRGKR